VSQWLVNAGAEHADGIDYAVDRVAAGNDFTTRQVCLRVGDLSDLASLPDLRPSYDIVLCLAVLQKMAQPDALLDFAIERCHAWLAIRVPGAVICDKRSQYRPVNVRGHVESAGFNLIGASTGGPWVGLFRRCT
jgi:hypothetical protein